MRWAEDKIFKFHRERSVPTGARYIWSTGLEPFTELSLPVGQKLAAWRLVRAWTSPETIANSKAASSAQVEQPNA